MALLGAAYYLGGMALVFFAPAAGSSPFASDTARPHARASAANITTVFTIRLISDSFLLNRGSIPWSFLIASLF